MQTEETNTNVEAPQESGAEAQQQDAQAEQSPQAEAAQVEQPAQSEEPQQPEETPPLDWDSISLPDGLQPDEELMGAFKEVVSEAGIKDKASVEKLIDLHVKALQKQYEQYQEVRKGWREQAAKELGDNIDSILGDIRDALVSYAPDIMDDFVQVMDDTGLGDHPVVIKVLHALASNLKEGSFTPGDKAATTEDIPPEQIFYGSNKQGG